MSLEGIAVFALQPHEDGHPAAACRLNSAVLNGPADAQQSRLVHLEVGVDGVERDDGGQQRRILSDQVALR